MDEVELPPGILILQALQADRLEGLEDQVSGRQLDLVHARLRTPECSAVGTRPAPGCKDPLGPGGYFFFAGFWVASSFSIWSMVAFISAIAASNGAEVVMSMPASLSRSMGNFEPPALSIAR